MPGLHDSEQLTVTNQPSFTWNEFCGLLDRPLSDGYGADLAARCPGWLKSPGQLFFEAHPQKRTLEVLYLKLCLLREVCALVSIEHEQVCRARGGISPEDVIVQVPEHRATMIPTCWGTTVSLKAKVQENKPLIVGMPPEMASDFTAVPTGMDLAYASPLVKNWPQGKKLPVTALIQSMDPLPAEGETLVRGAMQVHAIADGLNAKDFSDHDVFRVSFPVGDRRSPRLELWARRVGSPERGMIVSGTSSGMARSLWTQLTRTQSEVRSSAELAVYRAATPAHDVYSCGMLLLRALLGPDARGWEQASDLVPSIGERLQPVVQGLDPDDPYSMVIGVRDRLKESTDWLAAATIPGLLWWDAAVTVLRATSRIPGFSYAAGAVEYGPSPARLLERELQSIARRVRIELFEASERDVFLRGVSDRVLDELGARIER